MSEDKKIRSDTIEAVRSDLYKKYWKSEDGIRQQKFNNAYISEFLQRTLYTSDHNLVSEMLNDWKSKIKKEDNRFKVLEEMQMALLRMYVNHQNQEQLIAAAVSEYQIQSEHNFRLTQTNIELQKEVELLKSEIEFINKNG